MMEQVEDLNGPSEEADSNDGSEDSDDSDEDYRTSLQKTVQAWTNVAMTHCVSAAAAADFWDISHTRRHLRAVTGVHLGKTKKLRYETYLNRLFDSRKLLCEVILAFYPGQCRLNSTCYSYHVILFIGYFPGDGLWPTASSEGLREVGFAQVQEPQEIQKDIQLLLIDYQRDCRTSRCTEAGFRVEWWNRSCV